jgi:hypothetical protein
MISLKNVPADILNTKHNHYLDSIDYAAVEILRDIMVSLPEDAELISANFCNVYRRYSEELHKEPDSFISATPESWISYTHNGYYVTVELSRSSFWVFDGASIGAWPIQNGNYYQETRYRNKQMANTKEEQAELIRLANNPTEVYKSESPISVRTKSDKEYTTSKRKIAPKFYAG